MDLFFSFKSYIFLNSHMQFINFNVETVYIYIYYVKG